eukprot:jgi/Psemu1/298483/fgenesh1_pm.590_\
MFRDDDQRLGLGRSRSPIPRVTNRITHVVQLVISIGERREEVGFLRFGLYGDDCPESVRSMLLFLSPVGISGVIDDTDIDTDIDIDTKRSPVTLLQGGMAPAIYYNNNNNNNSRGVEFGVPSQKKAYARSLGLREAGPSFVPERRPVSTRDEAGTRPHDVAGLVSIPEGGIGYYNNNNNKNVDEAYAAAFLITAGGLSSSSSSDVFAKRRVIGQVIDDESMEFLERLSSLPVQKQKQQIIIVNNNNTNTNVNKAPPLLKVTVLDTGIQKVGTSASASGNNKNNKKSK